MFVKSALLLAYCSCSHLGYSKDDAKTTILRQAAQDGAASEVTGKVESRSRSAKKCGNDQNDTLCFGSTLW